MGKNFTYNSDFALQTGDSFLRLGVATRRWWNIHEDEEAPTDIIPVIVNVSSGIELLLKSLVILSKKKPQNTHSFLIKMHLKIGATFMNYQKMDMKENLIFEQ